MLERFGSLTEERFRSFSFCVSVAVVTDAVILGSLLYSLNIMTSLAAVFDGFDWRDELVEPSALLFFAGGYFVALL